MKKLVIPVLIGLTPILIASIIMNLIIISVNGNYITQKTEYKYIKNLHLFRCISEGDHVTSGIKSGDTLSYFYKTPAHIITPFFKWCLSDVGTVRPGSELERKLDSMSDNFKKDGVDKLK